MKSKGVLPKDKGVVALTLAILLIVPFLNHRISLYEYTALIIRGNSVDEGVKLYQYIWLFILLFDANLLMVPYFLTRVAATRTLILRYIGLSFLVGVSSIVANDYWLSVYEKSYWAGQSLSMFSSLLFCYFSFGGYRRIMASRYYGAMIGALLAINLITALDSGSTIMAIQAGYTCDLGVVLLAVRAVATVAALRAARLDELAGGEPYGGVMAATAG